MLPMCRSLSTIFEALRAQVPVLCDLKPSGQYVATDLHQAGGIPQVMKMLLAHGLLHGDCITISGQTITQVLEKYSLRARADQDVIRPWSTRFTCTDISPFSKVTWPQRRGCQNHRRETVKNHRPCARVRLGRSLHGSDPGATDQAGRYRGDSL